ncbi:MAG: universal stress protein [Bacteroidales bacterium]|nr:universal stress protein [Bacteroidales bacterium]
MKNFVVPIDFSNESLNGLKMAILFSKKKAVDIQMIYVLVKSNESSRPKMENELEYAEENFNKILKEYTPLLGKDSRLEYIIKSGRIYQQVVEQASLKPDTVITASTHGASGFQEFFIGSNAYRIISATDSPVITLRKNECPATISKIVMPIDLSSDTRQKVPFTTEIAALFGAEIHVLGIYTSKSPYYSKKMKTYVSQVSGYVEGRTNSVIHEVHGDNVSDLVVNYSAAIDANLISITTETTAGISLIIGNTAHQILNKSDCPVLCQTPKALRKAGTFVSMGG